MLSIMARWAIALSIGLSGAATIPALAGTLREDRVDACVAESRAAPGAPYGPACRLLQSMPPLIAPAGRDAKVTIARCANALDSGPKEQPHVCDSLSSDQYETAFRTASGRRQKGNAWQACMYDAVNALAGQPEPAEIVVNAAYGACTKEEIAMAESVGGDDQFRSLLRRTMVPQELAHVMAIRAARAKVKREPPKPAIHYNKM